MFTFYIIIGYEILKSDKCFVSMGEACDALDAYLAVCRENGFSKIEGFAGFENVNENEI